MSSRVVLTVTLILVAVAIIMSPSALTAGR